MFNEKWSIQSCRSDNTTQEVGHYNHSQNNQNYIVQKQNTAVHNKVLGNIQDRCSFVRVHGKLQTQKHFLLKRCDACPACVEDTG